MRVFKALLLVLGGYFAYMLWVTDRGPSGFVPLHKHYEHAREVDAQWRRVPIDLAQTTGSVSTARDNTPPLEVLRRHERNRNALR
jgi:hypothetical protein